MYSRMPDGERILSGFQFLTQDCSTCPLKHRCTLAAARSVGVQPDERERRELRQQQTTQAFRDRYRRRPLIERAMAELAVHGIHQARISAAANSPCRRPSLLWWSTSSVLRTLAPCPRWLLQRGNHAQNPRLRAHKAESGGEERKRTSPSRTIRLVLGVLGTPHTIIYQTAAALTPGTS